MELDSKLAGISALFLVIGFAAGGIITFQHMDSQVRDLEERVSDLEKSSNVVTFNYSESNLYPSLFDQVDQSVVSVTAYGSENAQGSGFIYSKNGYIVTNEHVVNGATRVEVNFLDGSTRKAEIIGTDPYTDLAVLKVSKKNLRPLELANSSKVEEGQPAIAFGNPFGLKGTMTKGIISAKGRSLRTQGGFSTPNVLQTDAAINPGNSGGPLLNIQGEVVGVNTAIQSNTGTFSGIGFAIPSNTVKRVIPSLIEDGEHHHPWIGVSGVDVSPEIAERMNLANSTGFLVIDVVEGSPAAQAGILPGERVEEVNGRELTLGGDVIVGIGGQKVRGINDILLYLAKNGEVDETVNITVIRDGEEIQIPLTLAERSQRPQG